MDRVWPPSVTPKVASKVAPSMATPSKVIWPFTKWSLHSVPTYGPHVQDPDQSDAMSMVPPVCTSTVAKVPSITTEPEMFRAPPLATPKCWVPSTSTSSTVPPLRLKMVVPPLARTYRPLILPPDMFQVPPPFRLKPVRLVPVNGRASIVPAV